MKEAKYSPAEMPELVKLIVKAIGRYLCSRACEYARAYGKSRYVLDTEDLSDIWMIDAEWLEDHKKDIYEAAWYDPLFLKNIMIGTVDTPGNFVLDVVEDMDEQFGDELYERMETFLDFWCKMVVKSPKFDLEELRYNYNAFDVEHGERLSMLRHDLKCAILARKILLMAAEESNRDGQATFDIDHIPLPWADFHTRLFDDSELIEEFVPGNESEVARCIWEDVFLSKYLLMYEIRDFDESGKTGWLDIQIGTDLAEWDDGSIVEGEADCRYHDAMETYRRAAKSFEMLDWHGSYEELLAIYEYLQTPTEMVDIFNRTDRENKRKINELESRVARESGRYPWLKDVAVEITKCKAEDYIPLGELKKRTESPDPVDHPAHYADTCSLECIDVMELILGDDHFAGFLLGNAFKYLWRHKHKGGKEDLRKAKWYLDKFAGDQTSYDITMCDLYPKLRDMLVKQAGGEAAVSKL